MCCAIRRGARPSRRSASPSDPGANRIWERPPGRRRAFCRAVPSRQRRHMGRHDRPSGRDQPYFPVRRAVPRPALTFEPDVHGCDVTQHRSGLGQSGLRGFDNLFARRLGRSRQPSPHERPHGRFCLSTTRASTWSGLQFLPVCRQSRCGAARSAMGPGGEIAPGAAPSATTTTQASRALASLLEIEHVYARQRPDQV